VLSEGRRINLAKDIVIGDRVWFGDNVTVLKGVTVGNDSVLGIDAVVTKPVPPNSIAWIDEHARIHFVTSYSPYFAQELALISLDRFEVADTIGNRKLVEEDRANDRILVCCPPGSDSCDGRVQS